MGTPEVSAGSRYLKTPDGTVYGPVDGITLCAWAAEARVTVECRVSRDGQTWQDAVELPELRLCWQAQLPDGSMLGPVNFFALWELIQDGSLPAGTPVTNRLTSETVPLDASLFPVALKESRAMLDVMAALMAQSAGTAGAELGDLRQRLAQAEGAASDQLRLVGESQRLIVARDAQIAALEARLAEVETRQAEAYAEHDRQHAEAQQAFGERLAAAERAAQDEHARGAAALESLHEELERLRGEAAAASGGRDAAMARATALDERARVAESALADVRATAETLAVQRDAALQASEALKADYERRFAEIRAATEAFVAQARDERSALEAEKAALQAAAAELRTALSTAQAATATGDRRVADAEGHAAEAARTAEALQRQVAQAEAAAAEAAGRETAVRQAFDQAANDWRGKLAACEAEIESLKRAATETAAGWEAERGALKAQCEEHAARAAEKDRQTSEAREALAERDARLAEAQARAETLQAEGAQALTAQQERAGRLERELEQTIRRLKESRDETTRAQASLAELRERSAGDLSRMEGDIKSLQRDLQAFALLKAVTRVVREERQVTASRTSIDWLSSGAPEPKHSEPAPAADDKFAGLDLPQQVALLHQELKACIDDKERLRREVDGLRLDRDAAERRRDEAERSLADKAAQFESELQSGQALQRQTLEELEKRESAWRAARKKAEEQESSLQDRITALEGELARKAETPPVVIQGEWHPPVRENGAPKEPPPPSGDERPRGGPAVLNTVEAQLQAELEKWHSLSQDKGRKPEKARTWFKWKQT